jgi:hypothetical protein
MIVTEMGFLRPISGQAAKQMVNPSGENCLNSRINPNQPKKRWLSSMPAKCPAARLCQTRQN